MSIEDRLGKIFFEGWEDLGIEDPGISSSMEYSDKEISDRAPKPYNLASYDSKPKWEAMRCHPLYIKWVRLSIHRFMSQIYHLKRGRKKNTINSIGEIPYLLQDLMNAGVAIARKIDWDDAKDIVIAIQRHPILLDLQNNRDMLRNKLEKR